MRKRARSNLPRITAKQARQALQVLVKEGRLAGADVKRALRRREKLVRELKKRLAALTGEAKGIVAVARKAAPTRKERRKVRKAVSRAQRRAWELQGRYLGAVARLSRETRAKVREIRKSSGARAAIAAAKKLAKGSPAS